MDRQEVKDWLVQHKREIGAAFLLLLALLSFVFVAKWGLVQELNQQSVAALDEKKETVLGLAAVTSTSSILVGNIPGADGVAENLADLGNYLIIVFAGIWMQKYLLAITGILTFKILIPLGLVLSAGNLFWKNQTVRNVAIRLFLFGALIFTLIPGSISLSRQIEQTYQQSAQESIQKVEEAAEEKTSSGWNLSAKLAEYKEKVETMLSNMIEAVVVLIVTTCIIPIMVFALFIWITNLLFGLQIPIKRLPFPTRHRVKQ